MRTFYLLHNLLHYRRPSAQTLNLLYLIYTIRTAIFSYLCVFLPFYYYSDFVKMGFAQNKALIFTFLVFGVFQVAHIAGSLLATHLGRVLSVKKTFLFSGLILMATTLLLSFKMDSLTVFISGIGFGLHSGLWWVTYHLEFSYVGVKNAFGKQIGIRQALGIASGTVATIMAALIISRWGYMSLYLATSLMLISIIVAIFWLDDHNIHASKFSLYEMMEQIKKYPNDFLTYFGVGAEGFVAEIIWPLLLFFVFKEPLLVGALFAGVTVLAFAIRLIAGRLTDKLKQNDVENFGVVTVSLVWLGKFASPEPISLVVFDSLYRIFSAFYYIPATTLNYLRTMTENKTVYIASREIVVLLGKTTALLLAILLISWNVPIWWLLLIGVMSPFLSLFSKTKSER